jgi:hypothetical protein
MNKLDKLAELLLEHPEEHRALKDLSRKYAGAIPYSNEAGAKGLSTTQQLGYALQRGIIDNTQSGAKAVATGEANPDPKLKQSLMDVWNSQITDYVISGIAGLSENIPGYGIPLSLAISKILLVKAASKPNYFSIVLAIIGAIPKIGSKLSFLSIAVKNRVPITAGIARPVLLAIAKMGERAVKKIVQETIGLTLPVYGYTEDKIKELIDGSFKAFDDFVAQLTSYDSAISKLS